MNTKALAPNARYLSNGEQKALGLIAFLTVHRAESPISKRT